MFFHSNIKFLRKRKKRTQDDVALKLDMKRSTLSGYENEIAQPNIPVLIAFSDYYKISIDTLIKIDLSQLSEFQMTELENGFDVYIKGNKLRVLATTVDSENNENIELVPEKAKAGYMRGFADPDFIKELPKFQMPFLSKEKKYRTFQISGDSMLPIPDKSWVTAEFIQDWEFVKDNESYIILTLDDGIVFKVVENKLIEEKKLRLHSLNPDYKSYDLPASEIKEIWKFTHYISSELPEPEIPKNNIVEKIAYLQREVEKMKLSVY